MQATPSGAPLGRPTATPDPEALQALLTVSLAALAVLRPLYERGTLAPTDFAFDYLNPAGQRLLQLPERPATSFLAHFPQARASGAFASCCRVLATGAPAHCEVDYQFDGSDKYVYLVAQRQGEQLAVSFTDAPRPAVGTALWRQPSTDAAQQGTSVKHFLNQTNAAICVLRSPAHVLDYCNPAFEQLFLTRPGLPGRPFAEVFSLAVAQALVPALDGVYRTGITFLGVEREFALASPATQPVRPHYVTFSVEAYQERGRIVGVSIFAHDVTEVVLARRQHHALQAEIRTATQRQAQGPVAFYKVLGA